MVEAQVLIVLISRVISLILGSVIVVIAYRGYSRNKTVSMRYLSLALIFITLGTFVEGILYEIGGLGLNETHAIESFVNVIGFILMVLSLRVR